MMSSAGIPSPRESTGERTDEGAPAGGGLAFGVAGVVADHGTPREGVAGDDIKTGKQTDGGNGLVVGDAAPAVVLDDENGGNNCENSQQRNGNTLQPGNGTHTVGSDDELNDAGDNDPQGKVLKAGHCLNDAVDGSAADDGDIGAPAQQLNAVGDGGQIGALNAEGHAGGSHGGDTNIEADDAQRQQRQEYQNVAGDENEYHFAEAQLRQRAADHQTGDGDIGTEPDECHIPQTGFLLGQWGYDQAFLF